MRLSDLRKVTIRKSLRIRFRLRNGLECTLDEHGIARVPALASAPDFNLEQELEHAQEFVLEPAGGDKAKTRPRSVTRAELASLAAPATSAAAAAEEHDD